MPCTTEEWDPLDLIDTTDPAFADIATVLLGLRSLRMDIQDPEVIRAAIEAGRRIHEAGESDAVRVGVHRLDERRQRERQKPERVVYYARIGALCKIGVTANVRARMEALRPEELLVTEPGGHERERQRHDQFQELRSHSEWFRYEGVLVDHVERLRDEASGVPRAAS
jgi:hypothetical protein